MTDLRTRPIEAASRDLSTYHAPQLIPKQSVGLPPGTQREFLEAAARAAQLGGPLDVLLTVNWRSLFSDNAPSEWRALDGLERIRRIVERIRKWLKRKDLPVHYIWVREWKGDVGEHWHLALHLPYPLRGEFSAYVADLLGETMATRKRTLAQGRTKGEFACGECFSWHLAQDVHPERGGRDLALYLGKGEPSEISFRGAERRNPKKVRADAKYSEAQGMIVGNRARYGRHDIARCLKRHMEA